MKITSNEYGVKRINGIRLALLFAALAALLATQGLRADGVVFGVELLGGSNHTELEAMMADDVAITDDYTTGSVSATNKWNTPWNERQRPLGLVSIFYEHGIGDATLLLGVKHTHIEQKFNYVKNKLKPGSSAYVLPVGVKITERINDAETGVRLPLGFLGLPALTLTPAIGHRTEFLRGRFSGTGAGRDVSGAHNFLQYKQANLDDEISGPYGGAKIGFAINPKLHVFAGVYNFGLRGSKNEYEFEKEILDTLVVKELGLEFIETGVRSIGWTYTAGIKYKITKTLHLHLGYIYERFRVSYPDYTNLIRFHYTSSSGASLEIPSHADLITDRFIYGRQELREKRHVFLGVEYDLHL